MRGQNIPCTCTEQCHHRCAGECGCDACALAFQVYSEDLPGVDADGNDIRELILKMYRSPTTLVAEAPDDAVIIVRLTRYFSAHHMMMSVARMACSQAESFEHAMTTILMSALAIEALANAAGPIVLRDEWEDIEPKLGTFSKYQFICKELKVRCIKGEGIGQRLNRLIKLRDSLAHAKPDHVTHMQELTAGQYRAGLWSPEAVFRGSAFEKALTADMAKEAIETFDATFAMITSALPDGDRTGIDGDSAKVDVALKNKPAPENR